LCEDAFQTFEVFETSKVWLESPNARCETRS